MSHASSETPEESSERPEESSERPEDFENQDIDELTTDVRRGQDRLAADINELVDRLHPARALERWKNEAVGSAKGFFIAGDGEPDTGRIAAVAGGVVGVLSLLVGTAILAGRSGSSD